MWRDYSTFILNMSNEIKLRRIEDTLITYGLYISRMIDSDYKRLLEKRLIEVKHKLNAQRKSGNNFIDWRKWD